MIGGNFTTFDGVQGVVTSTPNTSVTGINGIAAYVLNQQASSGGGSNSVGLFSAGISAVNGAFTWGINYAADR
jgi:hypothetical protein